jgi:hypothetical protein
MVNSGAASAGQLLLPLDDLCPEFFVVEDKKKYRSRREDAAFRMTFLKEYLKAGEAYGAVALAYERACQAHGRDLYEDRSRSSKAGNKILSTPESERMLDHLRARMRAEVEADVAEYYRSLRTMQQVAYGLVPVRESFIDPDTGEVMVRQVLMPNAANQAKAVELMGKAIGIFSERVNLGLSHDDALEMLDAGNQSEGA